VSGVCRTPVLHLTAASDCVRTWLHSTLCVTRASSASACRQSMCAPAWCLHISRHAGQAAAGPRAGFSPALAYAHSYTQTCWLSADKFSCCCFCCFTAPLLTFHPFLQPCRHARAGKQSHAASWRPAVQKDPNRHRAQVPAANGCYNGCATAPSRARSPLELACKSAADTARKQGGATQPDG
jgi:hypothetical protein